MEMFGETEVDVREVDQDSYVRLVAFDFGYKATVGAVDMGDVAKDLGDAHDSNVFRPDGAELACLFHLRAAEAGEAGLGKGFLERSDELSAVVISGGFARGEKDRRFGLRGNVRSLSGRPAPARLY